MEIDKLSDRELKRTADVLKAMAHPSRLRILCHLKDGARNVGQLQGLIGEDQALVSQQLRVLRLNGLVVFERKEGHVFYALSPEKKEFLGQIFEGICGCVRAQDGAGPGSV
jgi:DNA-binding transcriptional ArsR family regulator